MSPMHQDGSTTESGGGGAGNDGGWTSCTSSGAREAMEILSQNHNLDAWIPGPFVVMQGTIGDGMANTIDSMPELMNAESIIGTANVNAHADDRTNASSSISIPSDLPNEIPHLDGANVSANSSSRSELGSSLVQEQDGAGNDGAGINIIASQGSDGEIVCMADSMTSDISSLELVNLDAGNIPVTTPAAAAVAATATSASKIGTPPVSNVTSNSVFQNRTQMDRGLHLPLPASAVNVAAMGMAYNSFLPTVVTPSGMKVNQIGNNKITPKPRTTVTVQDNTKNVVLTDSFILVEDEQNDNSDNGEKPSVVSSIEPSGGCDDVASLLTQSSNIDIGKLTSCSTNPRYANMSSLDRRSIQQWKITCRQEEINQRNDKIDNDSISSMNESHLAREQWWTTKNGCLAVFDSLPVLSAGSGVASASASIQNDDYMFTTVLGNQIKVGNIKGEISPGATIMATEMHCIDESLIEGSMDVRHPPRSINKYQLLKIESPTVGYVVYSANGYCYLGPGLPTFYVEPEVWTWKVMCTSGSFVRQGLELTSVHTETIPYGSLVRVTRKTVNAMGLSRLRIETSVPVTSPSATDNARLVSTLRNRGRNTSPPHPSSNSSSKQDENDSRRVSGWVSAALNPLSGQRGSIVEPTPFPVPALYRVTLTDGAVIRCGVELSSPQIGHAPIGSILTIVGRAFSEHPADRCLERLKLAGSGGWISVRLNRAQPMNYLVVELVGIDGTFDPNEAGLYHIEKQRQVIQECNTPGNETHNMENMRQSLQRLSTISSIHDEEDDQGGNLENSELSNTSSSLTSAALPTLYRSGVANGSDGSPSIKACGSKSQKDEYCLICLIESRSATIVHGETGHIACCLTCARILKARGDKCPVCRLPIDSIIQQFWA